MEILEAKARISDEIPPRPSPKPFKPKCPELPELRSYHFKAPDSYWEAFPTFRNLHVGGEEAVPNPHIVRINNAYPIMFKLNLT